jgi:type I restriction enzyme S subunit
VVHKGDLLISTVRPNLHSHYKVTEDVKNVICSTGFCVIKTDEAKLNSDFLYSLFYSGIIDRQIELIVVGSSYPAINSSDIKKLEIPLPPLPEQRRIAEALSDTDALLAAMEKLIAKKCAIKQGAMQELLTGKRRLPGFCGKWMEKPLGELFDFCGGLSASREQLSTHGYPYLHYGDIHGAAQTFIDVCDNKDIPRLDVNLNRISNTFLLQNGDVVFVDASEDDEGASRHIVVRNENGEPFISGLHTIIARSKTGELNNLFKEFCFQTASIKAQFKFYAVGTKVTGVSKTTIGKIILHFPVDLAEQAAIAEILSDMDAEIDVLTVKLNKLRNIKQGMRLLLKYEYTG